MKVRYGFGLMALLLMSTSIFAGMTKPVPLTIDMAGMFASGNMVTSRFSDNDLEFIGCGSRTFLNADGSVYLFGFCQADNAAGDRAFCNSDNTGMVEAMGRLSDYAFVTFSWDVDGICTRVGSSTQSFYIPEHLDGMPGRGR